MFRVPLALALGIEPPPKRCVFDQLCGSSEGSGKFSRQSSQSSLPISTAELELQLPKIVVSTCNTAEGYLPANVLQQIVQQVGHEDLKSLHRVSRAWREAVCYGLRTIAPTTCDPAMLKRFPKIETLGMEHIQFEQPQLGKLTGLQTLLVQDCVFRHPISDLSTLTSLNRLKLKDIEATTTETDALLASLKRLTSLEVMRIGGQKTMPTMSGLSSLRNLKELVIMEAHSRDRMPNLSQIAYLDQLQNLTLVKVRVDNTVVREMSRLASLRSLEIPDCHRVTDAGIPSLSALTGLTKLDVRSTNHRREEELTDAGIASLSALENLKSLSLAGHSGLTSAGLDFLSAFTRLEDLNMRDVHLWTGGVRFLTPLHSLVHLYLARSSLTDTQLCVVGALTNLQSLDVSETFFGQEAAAQVAKIKSLEYLYACFCPLQNEGLAAIVNGCPNLKHASVDGCWISTLCMLRIVRQRPHLTMWLKGDSALPNIVFKVDTVLTAAPEPYCRRLRVLHTGEETWSATIGVFAGVMAFFLAYFIALFAIFVTIFLLPLAALGVVCLLLGIVLISIRLLSTLAVVLGTATRHARNVFLDNNCAVEAPGRVADMV